MNSLSTLFLFSPLEQFDSAIVFISIATYEIIQHYTHYILEIEYSAWERLLSPYIGYVDPLSFYSVSSFILVLILFVLKNYSSHLFIQDFSYSFFLTTLYIFSGFVLSGWFSDIALFELSSNMSSAPSLQGQLNFSFAWDENFISLLAAFFFFGGAEEEEDEDFLLEPEEADFVDEIVASMFVSNLGKDVEDNGALFLKVTSIFGFVLINNVMGMLPYSDTGISSLILTFWVALSVFASLLILMIRKHGVGYVFSLFMPAGCPLPLALLLVPIEFISYTFRLVSLSVRLFANMMAGHALVKVIVGFSWSMFLIGDIFLLVNIFPMAIIFVLIFLELGVALIQAYIFTLLVCIYLKDSFVSH